MYEDYSIHARDGPTPELPAENGVHVHRTAIVMPFITFIFVAARFYSRRILQGRAFALDDYIIAGTMVSIIVHAVLMANATYHGMGLHIWQFTKELNSEYYLWIGISSEFYVLSLAGFKSSLLLLYLQLFGLNRRFRIACYLALFYTLGYLTCNALTEFLGCTPIAKKWDPSLPGKCINGVAANIIYGAGHMTSDLIIGILPIVMVWKLEFPTPRQKIGLSLALGSGLIAWAVACVRWAISTYNMLSYDRPWWAGISFTFSILEVNTGLICACVATFSPLMSAATSSLGSFRSWASSLGRTQNDKEGTAGDEKRMWPQEDENELPGFRPRPRPQAFSTMLSNDSLELGTLSVASERSSKEDVSTLEPTPAFTPTSQALPTFSPVTPHDEFAAYDLGGLQALAAEGSRI
ncbi:hypothetical protein F4778DRAFT_163056 [Xylariomycetidae sp. FL2044]|nr:hypothetical protein F4778DRAFT_163056 [Xylariomycetidae sp. FL2044]